MAFFTSADPATAAWVAIAPIVTAPPAAEMPLRSDAPPRSMTSDGLASRCFIVGIRVCPPAMNLASDLPLALEAASAAEEALW